MSSHRVNGRPRFLWGLQAKFDSQLVRGFQEKDLAGHPSGERAIRCASRNFDRKSLPSQPSIGNKVFTITNLWFICTIMSRQLRSSWIRAHPIIDRSVRVCTTPSFCKQLFVNGKVCVNGKVASPKRIAGDTTASNNFSRKTKETCLFSKICLYLRNLFQATCQRWTNSKFLLAKKLPPKLRPKYLCTVSAWIMCTISPHTLTNAELSDGDVVNFFCFRQVQLQTRSCKFRNQSFQHVNQIFWRSGKQHFGSRTSGSRSLGSGLVSR